jgi:polysaccharide export outer membrane protein
MEANDKTPTQLTRDIEEKLRVYIQDPIVTVIVTSVAQQNRQHIRVLEQIVNPTSIPYHSKGTERVCRWKQSHFGTKNKNW